MPNIKSAIKRVKVTKVRNLRNASARSALRTTIKRFDQAFASADKETAQVALQKAIKALDTAAGKGLIHKNAAARKKSRLSKKFNTMAG